MKLKYEESNVLGSGGLQEVQSFKIRTNAHAFKMLSSGLYSDKIGAVLREIGCNAHDAHIAGGVAHKPFEVKMPNSIDDQFYIRDFGPGLSYDEVMNLYTTYFASTKQESDDFTGGFGLGSKSPFSYTDSFVITSRHGGKSRMFTAQIGNDGSPKIAMMAEEDCTDTGVEIGFPVPRLDYHEFTKKAQTIFQYFNPLPTILGGDPIKPPEFEKDFGGYAFRTTKRNYYEVNIKVQMGNVVYPVHYQKLTGITAGDIAAVTAFRYCSGILLRMPIGTLSVAASREELQYDDTTIKNLTKKLQEVVTDCVKELEAASLKVTSWSDKCEFREMANIIVRGLEITPGLMTTCGATNGKALYDLCNTNSLAIPGTGFNTDVAVYYCRESRSNTQNFMLERDTIRGYDNMLYIPMEKDIVIVSGLATRAAERIRAAIKDNKYAYIVAIYPHIGKIAVTQADIDFITDAIKAKMGTVTHVDMSDLDPPIRAKGIKRVKLAPGQFPDGNVYSEFEMLNEVLASTITDKIYIIADRSQRWGNIKCTYHMHPDATLISYWDRYAMGNFQAELNLLRAHISLDFPICVTPAQAKKLKITENPAWEEYSTYLRRVLTDQANVDILAATVKGYIPTVDLVYNSATPLQCLVQVKHKMPDIWNGIEPTLKKIKLLKDIESVHLASQSTTANYNVPELIQAYRNTVGTICDPTLVKALPDLDPVESAVNKQLSGSFRKLNTHFLAEVAEVSPAGCTFILNEALTT